MPRALHRYASRHRGSRAAMSDKRLQAFVTWCNQIKSAEGIYGRSLKQVVIGRFSAMQCFSAKREYCNLARYGSYSKGSNSHNNYTLVSHVTGVTAVHARQFSYFMQYKVLLYGSRVVSYFSHIALSFLREQRTCEGVKGRLSAWRQFGFTSPLVDRKESNGFHLQSANLCPRIMYIKSDCWYKKARASGKREGKLL